MLTTKFIHVFRNINYLNLERSENIDNIFITLFSICYIYVIKTSKYNN